MTQQPDNQILSEKPSPGELHRQLNLFGFETVRSKAQEPGLLKRISAAAAVLTDPGPDDLAFAHAGLCQTALPHRRPVSNDGVWVRRAGRFALLVQPGAWINPDLDQAVRVGVPYGAIARLLMLYLQTEGVHDREVDLGRSLTSWVRSLGLDPNGRTIGMVKEQALRLSAAHWTLQFGTDAGIILADQPIVEGALLQLKGEWTGRAMLSERFHAHLKEHAVPLDRRAIAHLSGHSLALDLYALCAYRLPKLERAVTLPWKRLLEQLGSEGSASELARRIRESALPLVQDVYPGARVTTTRTGLQLDPSPPAVPYKRGRRSEHLAAVVAEVPVVPAPYRLPGGGDVITGTARAIPQQLDLSPEDAQRVAMVPPVSMRCIVDLKHKYRSQDLDWNWLEAEWRRATQKNALIVRDADKAFSAWIRRRLGAPEGPAAAS